MSSNLFFDTSSDNKDEVNSGLAMFTEACQAVYEASKPKVHRTPVQRDRYGAHDRLVMAYFSEHPQYEEERFRMSRRLFTKIVREVTDASHFFQERYDSQILDKVNSVSKDHVKPKVLSRGKYAIDVEPILPRLRNNRKARLNYLRHLKESVETIRDIVEEAKVVSPFDRSIVSACRYTKHSQELLEYVIGTCPQDSYQRDKQLAHIPLIRKKQVTFAKPFDTSNSNTHKHVAKVNTQKTIVHVPPSAGVNRFTNASGSQPRSNTKKNRISPAKGVNKLQVKDQPRTNKSHLRTLNRGILVVALSVLQFRDSDLEVAFRKHSCYVRDTDSVKLIKGSRESNLYIISIEDMMKSFPICLLSKASK
nr:integrase, catalytic region, zinc finger, CCHC-type, peptidase aspartic, catalytic [Tanacetum cinerariifolium]